MLNRSSLFALAAIAAVAVTALAPTSASAMRGGFGGGGFGGHSVGGGHSLGGGGFARSSRGSFGRTTSFGRFSRVGRFGGLRTVRNWPGRTGTRCWATVCGNPPPVPNCSINCGNPPPINVPCLIKCGPIFPPVVWWHHHHKHWGVADYDVPAAVDTVANVNTAASPAPCNCLTKQYLDDGSVLFQDICTKEAALATPDELKAQAQGAAPTQTTTQ